jgi:fructose-1,6-bisphosphatase II
MMYDPSAVFYLDKLVTRPEAKNAVDIAAPAADNVRAVARARACSRRTSRSASSAAPRGIITACAMKAMNGTIQARLWPRDDAETRKAIEAGNVLDRVLHTDDLVAGDNMFFIATGITDGDLLRGVRYFPAGASTRSIVMRSRSGTIRTVESRHSLDKLRKHHAERSTDL